jgi:hypothetical protein
MVCNCSISGTRVLYAYPYAYYRKKRELFPEYLGKNTRTPRENRQ